MKRMAGVAAALMLLGSLVPAAGAGPSAGGLSSDNVEWVTYVPFDVGTASGAKIIGKYMYITSWRNFSIYDISDPLAPALLSTTHFGFQFENEDVDSNGNIMIFSEELPVSRLHIWDVENKEQPRELAVLNGAGQHTMSCLYNCKWLYGSDGYIVDLRDPSAPKLLDSKWTDGMPPISSPHDVNEIAPGIVLTSSDPMLVLDARKDVAHPKLMAISEPNGAFIHTSKWPNKGKDRFAMSTGETWLPGADARCDDTSGAFTTWDTSGWQKGKVFTKIDVYKPTGGTYADGKPPSGTTFGCSTHWFEYHPDFHNGGLVGVAFFNHGTRFLHVDSKGKVSERGYFIPHVGNAAAVEWPTKEIVYSIDLQRGFDILKYKGDL